MKTMMLLGAAAAALLAIPALAQDGGRETTRADVQARTAAAFGRTDANRDGSVTGIEAQAARAAMRGRRGGERGGKSVDAHWAELDRDRSGSISRAEFDAHHAGERSERRADRAERRVERRTAREARGLRMNPRQFARADTNRDGRLTLAEAQTVALARFAVVDSNRDGVVTRDERRAQRDKRQGRRAEGDAG